MLFSDFNSKSCKNESVDQPWSVEGKRLQYVAVLPIGNICRSLTEFRLAEGLTVKCVDVSLDIEYCGFDAVCIVVQEPLVLSVKLIIFGFAGVLRRMMILASGVHGFGGEMCEGLRLYRSRAGIGMQSCPGILPEEFFT
jgi:hypothetical protein